MKRRLHAKLSLHRETVRGLDRAALSAAPGGMQNISEANPCFSAPPSCYCGSGSCTAGCVTDNEGGCVAQSLAANHCTEACP